MFSEISDPKMVINDLKLIINYLPGQNRGLKYKTITSYRVFCGPDTKNGSKRIFEMGRIFGIWIWKIAEKGAWGCRLLIDGGYLCIQLFQRYIYAEDIL